MDEPSIRTLADAEDVSRTAAAEFARIGREAIQARGRFIVALSGGSTPRRLYELLSNPPFRGQLEWPFVEFFWGDERAVPPDHPDSNFRMAREAMLAKLDLSDSRVHRIEAERADRTEAARDYQAEIARICGASAEGEPPRLDLVLLGMGPDAHTASLFPSTEALKEKERWVVANFVPKLAAERLTLTPVILNRAANVIFLVAGDDKADALAEVLEGPPDPERLPTQLIRPESGKLLWLVDRTAASRLERQS